MYSIKEVSKKLNISEHTLRYYTDQELIPSLKRDNNNRRVFDDESILWLKLIMCLRGCGLSIKEIKKYIDLYKIGSSTIEERYKIILDQQQVAKDQLIEAKERYTFINKKVHYYEELMENKIVENGITDINKKNCYSSNNNN